MKLKARQALRAKSSVELTQLLRDAKKNQARTQLEIKMGKHTNVHSAKLIRHEIALIKTFVKENVLKEIKGKTSMATKKQPKQEAIMMKQDNRKTRLIGVVVSDKMTKTVVVKIERTMRHPLYRKTIKSEKKYKAHDELGAMVGDRVLIEETRPMSKDKRFIVKKIFEKTLVIAPELTQETDLDLLLGIEKKDKKLETESDVHKENA